MEVDKPSNQTAMGKELDKEELTSRLGVWEEKARKFMDSVADAVITIDSDVKVREFNRAAEKIFSYSSEEMIGESITKIIPCFKCTNCEKESISCFENWRRNAVGKVLETSATTKEGNILSIELSFSDTSVGDDRRITTVIRDATEWAELKANIEE